MNSEQCFVGMSSTFHTKPLYIVLLIISMANKKKIKKKLHFKNCKYLYYVILPPLSIHRFHVNLQCGTSTQPRADIALHFNPRFGGQKVVRNTLKKQQWGGEEKGHSYFPFGHNQNFEIIILCEPEHFKVPNSVILLFDKLPLLLSTWKLCLFFLTTKKASCL